MPCICCISHALSTSCRMSSPPAPGRRARALPDPVPDVESGVVAQPSRRVQPLLAQLGARDDGRAALLLFVLFLLLQQSGVVRFALLVLLAFSCLRCATLVYGLGEQVAQVQASLALEEARVGTPVGPLALQMRLLSRELTPADYAALLQLDDHVTDRPGLSPAQLAALPRHTLSDGAGAGDSAGPSGPACCCAVCLEDAVAGEELVTLPCAHAFHANCIQRWLAASQTCPVCKRLCVPPQPP